MITPFSVPFQDDLIDTQYPPIDVPATPEYVLEVFRDMHRQACQINDADPDVSLSFDTTIAEWRDAWLMECFDQLGPGLNEFWGLNCDEVDWRAVLKPEREGTLGDVCRFIARRANRPVVCPAQVLGRACKPAGAFLTVRSILQKAGAPADDIGPSTLLAPFTRRYYQVFLGPISKLAPGALPPVRIHNPADGAATLAMMAGMIVGIVGIFAGYAVAMIGGVIFLAAGALQHYVATRPASVEFGELRTFRDLAMVIADGGAAEPVATPYRGGA